MQSLLLLGRESIDASGHDALQRFGQIHRGDFTHQARASFREHHRSGFNQRPEKLFQEKRVAFGPIENDSAHLVRQVPQL